MNMRTITPIALAEAAKTSAIELLDVRTPMEYQAVHIPHARNVPLDELDPVALARSHGERTDPIYIVCRSGGRGKQACGKFLTAGYENVVNVEGGTAAWETAGLPVVRGRSFISLERQVRIAAGSLALLGVALAWLVDPAFVALTAFVGAGLIYAGVTDTCGMALILAKMPWNQMETRACCSTSTSSTKEVAS